MIERARRVRRPGGLQPLRRRLGARDGHAVPVDQAGRLALRRHAQRHDRALARAASRRKGEIRTQFHHVIDVAPTVLEAAGLPRADVRQRRPAEADRGREHGATRSTTRRRAERHETQYFEMFGNRGIYHKGWTAVTRHSTPVGARRRRRARLRRRRLGALRHRRPTGRRPTTSPAQHPEKLHELQRLWLIEAVKYNVLPLDDRVVERVQPDIAGRPTLIKGNSQLLFGGMGRLTENSVVNIKNKSHSVTAEIVVPDGGAEGVIIAQGGSIGGWSLYAKDGKLEVLLQLLRPRALLRRRRRSRSRRARTRCGWSSPTTAAASARAAPSRSTSTARRSARARVGATAAMIFSADETCDVGKEGGSPVARGLPVAERVHRRGQLGRDRRRTTPRTTPTTCSTPTSCFRVAMARQ